MGINRVTISGNLTRDPELRTTASGMAVLGIGVAVNDRRKNSQTGEWEDVANFIDCTMFGSRAQSVSNYLSKGSKVAIEGKLRWSQWEREGQKRSKIEVIIDEIELMSTRNNGGYNNNGYNNNNGSNNGGYQAQSNNFDSPENNASSMNNTSDTTNNNSEASGSSLVDTSSSIYDDDIPF